MKKALAIALFVLGLPVLGQAFSFGSGGAVDYSRDSGNSFYCASTTTFTTQAGVSATGPALVLVNPTGSSKLLTLLDVGVDVTASPAAAAGFMLAYSTGSTNVSTSTALTGNGGIVAYSTNTVVTTARILTVVNSSTTQVGLSAGQCYGGPGTVLPSKPISFRYLGGTTGASAIGGAVFTDQTDGKVVLPPGAVISFQSTSAAAVIVDFLWREDAL